MPHTAKLRKVGGSIMLAIPPNMLADLNLTADSQVGLEVANGKLMVEPRKRPKYTLEELLKDYDPTIDAELREWLDAPPVGREII